MGEPTTRVYERDGKVVLRIQGHYTGEQATQDVRDAEALFQRLQRCDFVPDMRGLVGYDTGARTAWQEKLSEFRPRIQAVVMVGGSPIVRMSGGAVCLYAGIKMRFCDHLEDAFRAPGAAYPR